MTVSTKRVLECSPQLSPFCIKLFYSCLAQGLKSAEIRFEEWPSFGRASQMLQVNVALPNGNAELRLPLPPSSTVQDLKTAAKKAFGKKFLRLVTAKNRILLDPDKTLEEAEIEDGECLTALVLQPQLAATTEAFAAILRDGSVVACNPG